MFFLLPIAAAGVAWIGKDIFDWATDDPAPAGSAGQYPTQLISPGVGGAVNLALLGLAAYGGFKAYKAMKS